jgi:hypothetical protein
VLWSPQPKGWTVHSTIVANSPVASLDFWDGTLALGTQTGVELWRTENAEVVVWDRIWTGYTDPSPMVALPPERSHVAWYFEVSFARKYQLTAGRARNLHSGVRRQGRQRQPADPAPAARD